MGKHLDHRAHATGLGITVPELKHVLDLVADAELGLAEVPRPRRREVMAERLDVSQPELTRLLLALTTGANGRAEREIVQLVARRQPLLAAP